jgi:hypothetical protein
MYYSIRMEFLLSNNKGYKCYWRKVDEKHLTIPWREGMEFGVVRYLWNAAMGCSDVAIKYFSSTVLSSLFSLPFPTTWSSKQFKIQLRKERKNSRYAKNEAVNWKIVVHENRNQLADVSFEISLDTVRYSCIAQKTKTNG